VIDRLIDGIAWSARQLAGIDAWIDRNLVDGLVNATAMTVPDRSLNTL
jgi:hypothetical protein